MVSAKRGVRCLLLLALCMLLPARITLAQQAADVPYVPTPQNVVDTMLEMALVNTNDYLIDLGSGDGRIVIAAAKKHGAHGMGVELDMNLVLIADEEAKRQGVAGPVTFLQGNLFNVDLSKATVLTLYLFPRINLRLRPGILSQMKPGTRVAAHQFNMGDWEPDESADLDGRNAYLWIVPARVAGAWHLQAGSDSYDITLTQSFQKVAGVAKVGDRVLEVHDSKLRGEQISLVIGNSAPHQFSGRVTGDAMEGTVRSGGAEARWNATRR